MTDTKWQDIIQHFMDQFNPTTYVKEEYLKFFKPPQKIRAKIKQWSLSSHNPHSFYGNTCCEYYVQGEIEYDIHFKKSRLTHHSLFCLQANYLLNQQEWEYSQLHILGIFGNKNQLLHPNSFSDFFDEKTEACPTAYLIAGKTIQSPTLNTNLLEALRKYCHFKALELGLGENYIDCTLIDAPQKALFIGHYLGDAAIAGDMTDDEDLDEFRSSSLPLSSHPFLYKVDSSYLSNYKSITHKRLTTSFWKFIPKILQSHKMNDFSISEDCQLKLVAQGPSAKAYLVFGKKINLDYKAPWEEIEISEELGHQIHWTSKFNQEVSPIAIDGICLSISYRTFVQIDVGQEFIKQIQTRYSAYLKQTGQRKDKWNKAAYYILVSYEG